MSTISEFITARLDEDETTAKSVAPDDWGGRFSNRFDSAESDHTDADRDHVNRFDPDRVLAQCAALRAVVELHRAVSCDDPEHHHEATCDECLDEYPCPTIRHIAGIWRDHNDWREEWSA